MSRRAGETAGSTAQSSISTLSDNELNERPAIQELDGQIREVDLRFKFTPHEPHPDKQRLLEKPAKLGDGSQTRSE